MLRLIRSLTLLLALAISPAAVSAQTQGPDTPVSSDSSLAPQPVPAAGSLSEPNLGQEGELTFAERVEAPRTLRDYWHLFIAFALAWALLFGYALSLGRRFRSLETAVQKLEDRP